MSSNKDSLGPDGKETPEMIESREDGFSEETSRNRIAPISRRGFLAATGGSLALGGLIRYAGGARPFAPPDCGTSDITVEDDEWSFPDHDRQHTSHAPGRAAPDSLQERWHTEWDIHNHGPPTVANGLVFVASTDKSARETLRALDLYTGDERWTVKFSESGGAYPVVAAGDTVYYHTNPDTAGRTAFALAMADGNERWTDTVRDLHAYPPSVMLADGSAVLTDPTLNEERTLVRAVDSRSGEECWRTALNVTSLQSYAGVAGGDVYFVARTAVSPEDGSAIELIALDATTGESTWRTALPGDAAESFVLGSDHAYVAALHGPITAVSFDTGETIWQHERTELFGEDEAGVGFASPSHELGALTPDALVVRLEAHSDASDRLRAFDPMTGEILWTRVAQGHDAWFTTPTAAGSEVFVAENQEGSGTNRLLRLDAASGKRRESVPYQGWTHSSPVFTEGIAIFVTGSGVSAFRP
ncbi:hypothetical protein E2L06_16290 [Haloterrigena sp. H1]|uniref:outer membrane protein assembly factor BamB family protein n=1 Tax=Haloterrigena sp. H1 TaxID=2552943 RepID=UPI00110DB952|nr:PQQ-binding-like beta-propeller repeat protein [Haloterrigena sp. H1]TMT81524.1 hypothetical protein E2L06_16290 [Haloterrigena sp. H1]